MFIKRVIRKIHFLIEKRKFIKFENTIHPQAKIISNQNIIKGNIDDNDIHPNFKDKHKLHWENLNDTLLNKYTRYQVKVMVHTPSLESSPGGYSLFMNFIQGLELIGVKAFPLFWNENLKLKLDEHQPDIFLSSDSEAYKKNIDWKTLLHYKKYKKDFLIGLTASLERYGSGPLTPRLLWAKEHHLDFFYSFRSREYINQQYQEFLRNGFQVINFEFGANPIKFKPINIINKDLTYSFLASSNYEKWQRYFDYLPSILSKYPGLINGPGWSFCEHSIPQEFHKIIYGRSKVGINLHIDESINYKSELNERTYILAASGVPQLIDNPLLLADRFSTNTMFIAKDPIEYSELFAKMINSPDECTIRSLNAFDEVMSKHTSLHRADDFIVQINSLRK